MHAKSFINEKRIHAYVARRTAPHRTAHKNREEEEERGSSGKEGLDWTGLD